MAHSPYESTESPQPDAGARVLVLHGLASNRLFVWPLTRRLRSYGFAARSWGYRSLFPSIDYHAERLGTFLAAQPEDGRPLHLVGHSMGCIILRRMLASYRPPSLQRVVLVTPPNHGSPVARFLTRCGLRFRPLRELSDEPDSFVNRLEDLPSDLPVGILAASTDRVVPLRSTRLRSVRDYRILRAGHTSILFRRRTARLVAGFLDDGQFPASTDRPRVINHNASGSQAARMLFHSLGSGTSPLSPTRKPS